MKTRYWYWIWKTFLSPSRLRKKFVRAFLTTGLIPLLLMGGVSFYLVSLIHRIDVGSLEENLARQVALQITQTVDDAIAKIQLEVAYPDFAPIARDQQLFFLKKTIEENPSLTAASFICLTPAFCTVGEETTRIGLSASSTIEEFTPRDQRDRPEFKEARKGITYVGQADYSEEGLSMRMGSPVFNSKREIIAVLAAELKLDRIQKIVKDTTLGTTGYVYLIDDTGQILAHHDPKNIGLSVAPLEDASTIFKFSKSTLTEGNTATYKSLDGFTVNAAGASILKYKWGVIAEWPTAETQRLITTILLQILGFSAIALIFIIFVSGRLAYTMIGPIAYLGQGTNIIGAGNFDYRVHVKTGDELEDLAKNLNKMAENLKGLEEVHDLKLKTQLLSESLKKEQDLSRLKDQFITTVSHQFNTPLSVMDWTLAGLKDQPTDKDAVHEGLRKIDQSRQDILAIVNDLLTLSEIGFTYKKSNTKLIDIRTLVSAAIQNLHYSISEKHLTFRFLDRVPNTKAEANEFAIEKAVENLIDNAVTYSNEDGIITIELDGNDRAVSFKITDQGIGIPEEDQQFMFQQFFRAKNAVVKKNVGTGLGLFIVKTIIEGHGGTVSVHSREGNGSMFSFTIPR